MKQRQRIRDQIRQYALSGPASRRQHTEALVEGYYIQDESHPALRHNKTYLQPFDIRTGTERGLRAKVVSWPCCPHGS